MGLANLATPRCTMPSPEQACAACPVSSVPSGRRQPRPPRGGPRRGPRARPPAQDLGDLAADRGGGVESVGRFLRQEEDLAPPRRGCRVEPVSRRRPTCAAGRGPGHPGSATPATALAISDFPAPVRPTSTRACPGPERQHVDLHQRPCRCALHDLEIRDFNHRPRHPRRSGKSGPGRPEAPR